MNVTVVIPAFNRPEMLRRAIDSVLAQEGVTDVEVFVVDDFSTDPQLEQIREHYQQSITWLRNATNLGPAASRNRGAAAGSGKWIAFLDSDDRWLPQKLARQLEFHAAHPDLRMSQCEETWIRNGNPVRKPKHLAQPPTGPYFEESTRRCCISPSAVMIRCDLWNETAGFDEFFRICEDYEYWLRLTKNESVGLISGKDLVEKYGGHDDQLSRNVTGGIDRWRVLALQKLLQNGLETETQFAAAVCALHEKSRIAAKHHSAFNSGS